MPGADRPIDDARLRPAGPIAAAAFTPRPAARARRRVARLLGGATAVALLLVPVATARAAQSIDVVVTQATGTAPFDASAGAGNDTTATDDVVRSNDTVTYQIQLNVNDTEAGSSTARDVTVQQTLPAGMRWPRLPATCLTSGVTPVSSISPDGQTITCNIGDIPTGVARTLALSAGVTEMDNGTVLTPGANSVTVDADGATSGSATPDPVTVSSVPRVDMVKSAPNVTVATRGGVDGYLLRYPVSVQIPSFGGRGLVGYEPPAAAIRFQDDFTAVSPNAEFVSCDTGNGGTWTCPAAGAAAPLTLGVTLTDPDSITSGTLASNTATIFVPKSDVQAAPGQQLQTTNRLQNLDARDRAGNSAQGENPGNNTANATISLSPDTGFGIYKHYVDVTAPGRYIPGGANTDRNGFSTVGPGQIFQGEVRVGASNPAAGHTAVAACDVFDTTTQQATVAGPATAHGDQPAWLTTNTVPGGPALVLGTDIVLEYSTAATSTDPDDATRWAALRATDCAGTAGWSTTPPADPATITKVRLRFLTTPPFQYTVAFAVNLVAKPGADATTIANFATSATEADGGTWKPSTYDPATHNTGLGDRLILTGAQLTLEKAISDPATSPSGTPSVRGGEDVQFTLTPRAVVPSQSTTSSTVTARDVVVTDVLPAGTSLSTVAGHGPSPAPTSSTVNPDGTTTLTWNLGTVTSDDTPEITYWVTVSNTASGAKVNRAIVTSPDDAGSPRSVPSGGTDPHFAARTINVDSLGGIQVDKAVDPQVVEPLDTVTFSVIYANLDATPRTDMDVIDVLPFNGDDAQSGTVPGRSPGSAFHGQYTLQSVDVHDSETVRYTDAAAADVYATYDPSAAAQAGYGSLPSGKAWCTAAQIGAGDAGCPASIATATAIRVTRTGDLGAGENRTFSYTIRTDGSRSGDIYANTAALRSSSLTLGTLSPTRTARVVANRIGDYVWEDLDKNGRQDAGEPGVPGVRVTLEGTDKHGRAIYVTTTTDANGRYLFTSSSQEGQDDGVLDLVSGTYHVTFDPATLPPRASFTTRHADGVSSAEDSDADQTTGRTQEITLPDPSSTGTDGEDLTLDAGIVIAPEPPVTPPTTPPVTPPTTPPTTTPPPTTTTPPPARRARAPKPRLTLRKTASRTSARPGQTVTYTLTVRNTGKGDATRVALCDDLPDHLTLASGQAQLKRTKAKLASGRVCWQLGTVKAGAKVVRTFSVRIDRTATPGTIVNHATVDRTKVRGVDARAQRGVKVLRPAGAIEGTSHVTG